MGTPLLIAVCDGLAGSGLLSARFNLPYAERGRKSPGSPRDAIAAVEAVASAVVARTGRSPVLGGKSYGGRMASHAVAEGSPAAGLLFLGYPLHPPGKPDALRDEHLRTIGVPMLFLQGTRDPFARRDLLENVAGSLGRARIHLVEDGDHSLGVRGRPAGDVTAEILSVITGWIRTLD